MAATNAAFAATGQPSLLEKDQLMQMQKFNSTNPVVGGTKILPSGTESDAATTNIQGGEAQLSMFSEDVQQRVMSPNADLESQALLEGIQENEGEQEGDGDGDKTDNQSPEKLDENGDPITES